MCRTLHCMMMMSQGHGRRISTHELTETLQQLFGGLKPDAKEQTHEEFIADAIERATVNIRVYETALGVLQAEAPREGAKLVGLEMGIPRDPKKHGVSSVASYALEDGSFLVVGTDHLTQFKTEHTTPNEHGLDALIHATGHELTKRAVAAAEAEEALSKAEAQPS